MHEQDRRRRRAPRKRRARRRLRPRRRHSVRGGGEIGGADCVAIGIAAEQILDAGAVRSGRVAENAIEPRAACRSRRAAASGFSSSSSSRAATACTAASISAICAGKRSRNSPEMRQVTSTRGRPIAAAGSTSTPVTRPVAGSQIGRQPMQRKTLRDLLAAGAQRGAAPEIDDDRARHLAVRLQMRAHHFVGGEPAEIHRGRRRQGARIGGEQIAAGRQHIAPSARRRAGRARRVTRRPSSAASKAARSASALARQAGSSMPAGARP